MDVKSTFEVEKSVLSDELDSEPGIICVPELGEGIVGGDGETPELGGVIGMSDGVGDAGGVRDAGGAAAIVDEVVMVTTITEDEGPDEPEGDEELGLALELELELALELEVLDDTEVLLVIVNSGLAFPESPNTVLVGGRGNMSD